MKKSCFLSNWFLLKTIKNQLWNEIVYSNKFGFVEILFEVYQWHKFFPIASQLKQEIGNNKSDWTKKTEMCQIEKICKTLK